MTGIKALLRGAGARPFMPASTRDREHWTDHAACLNRWDIWDAETPEATAEALAGCAACPVFTECVDATLALSHAVDNTGVRAGMTANERWKLRRGVA